MEEKKKSRFVIEPAEAEALMKESGAATAVDLLPSLAGTAQGLARPPISSFPVGAAAVGSTGRIYLGCNVEFPGLPLHHSIHAEQFLVANALLHREPRLLSLAVTAAPCGHCRQFLQELRNAPQIRILITSDPSPHYLPLLHFLPLPFGPADLLHSHLPFLLEKETNNIDRGLDDDRKMEHRLIDAATEAARGAHAPYSGCPSGFAVMDREGRTYAGSYMESAAYNPSLGPVQAAMVAYVVGGGVGWDGIVGGALAEAEGAKVEQEGTVRVFFDKVAPSAEIWVSKFRLGEL